jgi:hypothetical protein
MKALAILTALVAMAAFVTLSPMQANAAEQKREGAILTTESKVLKIPTEYLAHPADPNTDYAIITVRYPSMTPYGPLIKKAEPTLIRIDIGKRKRITKTESFLQDYERLHNTTDPQKLPSAPKHLGRQGIYDVYQSASRKSGNIETWRITKLTDETFVGLKDPGSWSEIIEGNRLIFGFEVTYQFRKSLNLDPLEMDKAVTDFISRFITISK